MHLDEFDRILLHEMQGNSRQTTEQLASKVGLSASAVQRRLKRLRESRVIENEIAILSTSAVGEFLAIVVEIEFEQENMRLIQQFKELMKSRNEVTQCYQTAGRTDFILVVVVRDINEYNAFAKECFLQNKHLKRYQTNVVLDHVKVGLQLPIKPKD